MILHSKYKKILSFSLIVFSIIVVAVVSCIMMFSCTAGVNIGEADKILDTFNIEWPAGLNDTCDMDSQIWITISARDQNDDVLNLNDAVELLLTNNNVTADPKIILLTNGSANIQITFTIVDSLDDEQTDVLVRYDGKAYDVCTLLVINTLKPVINVKQVDTAPPDILNGGSFDFSDIVIGSNEDVVFIIENNGGSNLELASIPADRVVLSGIDSSAFTVHEEPDDQTIVPGNETPFTLRFSPDEARIYRAKITIQSNDLTRETYTINLIGQGTAKLTDFPGAEDDLMGYSVSMSGNNALVGAWYDDDNGVNSGSAYLFIRSDSNWGEWNETDSHWDRSVKLLADDGVINDYFGYAVSISDDYAMVGAPAEDTNASDSGSVYVFYKDQGGADAWGQFQRVHAGDGVAHKYFGASVSISGDRAIIGAPRQPNWTGYGSAFIYHFNGSSWVQQQELNPTLSADSGDYFGCSVSINGDYAVVGAYADGPNEFGKHNIGVVYVYHWNGSTWVEQQVLTASDYNDWDRFGHAVAIHGDLIAIGSPYNGDSGYASGTAYIFKRNGTSWGVWNASTSHWDENQKIMASNGATQHYFGHSVCAYQDSVVVGAPGSINGDISTGWAYVFSESGGMWTEQKKLLPSDGYLRDAFGWSVSMSNSYVLVGARSHDIDVSGNGTIESTEENIGAGYIYYWDGSLLSENEKLVASDVIENGNFGYSVSIDGDYAIVGAVDAIGIDTWSGAAYIYHWSGSAWVQQQKLSASDGEAADNFGWSVSIKGNYAIIGAYADEGGGSAYIFERNGSNWGIWNSGTSHWDENQKLTASDRETAEFFGYSVAIDDDFAFVGAAYDNDNGGPQNGSVYIFYRNGSNWGVWNSGTSHWDENQELYGQPSLFDSFGSYVSLDGDYAVAGAMGWAIVFYWNGSSWEFQQTLTPSGGSSMQGNPVAISGDRILIGAQNDSINGSGSGSVSAFTRNGSTWTETEVLVASDGAASDQFGCSVWMSGNYAVVGTWHDDDSGSNSGSGYLFFWNGDSWTEQRKLYASDGEAGDLFGRSVSISGNRVMVGAYEDDIDIDDNGTIESNEEDIGSVYFFNTD